MESRVAYASTGTVITMKPGRFFTILGSIAVLGIGTGALLKPAVSTRTYGIPNDEPDVHAYVRAVAARDLVMGGFVLWAAIVNDKPAMEAGLLVCTLAPLADFLLARERRGMIPQLITHGSGVVGIFATYAILRAESSSPGESPTNS
jgi:hypothetical protein